LEKVFLDDLLYLYIVKICVLSPRPEKRNAPFFLPFPLLHLFTFPLFSFFIISLTTERWTLVLCKQLESVSQFVYELSVLETEIWFVFKVGHGEVLILETFFKPPLKLQHFLCQFYPEFSSLKFKLENLNFKLGNFKSNSESRN